jgi:hypothetical protein
MTINHPCEDRVRKEVLDNIAKALLGQSSRGSLLHAKFKKLISSMIFKASVADIEIVDVGYDKSCFGVKTTSPVSKNIYSTINDFLDYPTGDSTPTFCSGSGMSAERWEDRVIDDWREIVVRQYNSIPEYQDILSVCSWTDWQGHLITDKEEIIEDLDQALCDYIIDAELLESWRNDPIP